MARSCSICESEARPEIEEALALGKEPLRELAQRFGTSKSALQRHRGHGGPAAAVTVVVEEEDFIEPDPPVVEEVASPIELEEKAPVKVPQRPERGNGVKSDLWELAGMMDQARETGVPLSTILEAEIARKREELGISLPDRLYEIHREVQALERQRQTLQDEYNSLGGRAIGLKNEIAGLKRADLDLFDEERATEEIRSRRMRYEEAKKELAQVGAELDILSERISKVEGRIATMEGEKKGLLNDAIGRAKDVLDSEIFSVSLEAAQLQAKIGAAFKKFDAQIEAYRGEVGGMLHFWMNRELIWTPNRNPFEALKGLKIRWTGNLNDR